MAGGRSSKGYQSTVQVIQRGGKNRQSYLICHAPLAQALEIEKGEVMEWVVVARDLVDAMYDPRTLSFVSNTRGTELVIEHIETMWCPTIVGEDLTRVVPGSDNPPAGRS